MLRHPRSSRAEAAYAKAAEIRSEPCSLTALRLNLQLSPLERHPPFFVGVLSGWRVCNSIVQRTMPDKGAPWGPGVNTNSPFPPTRRGGVLLAALGSAGPQGPFQQRWGGGAFLVPAADRGSFVLSGRGEVGSTHSAQRSRSAPMEAFVL